MARELSCEGYTLCPPKKTYIKPAKDQLAVYLQRDGKFTSKREEFDYTVLSWQDWLSRSFNYREVRGGFSADGLPAAMGAFTLRALAKGYVEPNDDGTHTIHVTGCSVFAYDTFNFEGDDDYGYWSKEERKFLGVLSGSESDLLNNTYFNEFRSKHGVGNDFSVFSNLHPIGNFSIMEYTWP